MSSVVEAIPVLVYRDIPAAHRFLVDVFGFESGGVECDPEGIARHGEVRVGGARAQTTYRFPKHNDWNTRMKR